MDMSGFIGCERRPLLPPVRKAQKPCDGFVMLADDGDNCTVSSSIAERDDEEAAVEAAAADGVAA